jgi:hypothetical protein
MSPMHGLLDLDVMEADHLLARAAPAHPEVHANRNWRGQVVSHRHVDVNTIVEIERAQGPFSLAHVIRDADVRDVIELTAELRRVKIDPSGRSRGRPRRAALVGRGSPACWRCCMG